MAITYSQYQNIATQLKVDTASVLAISKVESKGDGFLADGRPKILFEGHIFWKQLIAVGKNPKDFERGNENILYPHFDRTKYLGGVKEYDRQERAAKIDQKAALLSASYGAFQIMGFNYAQCGFTSIEAFVASMKDEALQLLAFAQFIKKNGLLKDLQEKNWSNFARKYNGNAYKENKYDTKLQEQYDNFSKIQKKADEEMMRDSNQRMA